MCLLVLAWRRHPRFRLVVAANRDEFHARPAAGLAPWDDAPGIVGGRDLQAGGAWFAVDPRGRTGIVTNFREFGRRRRSAPSRGGLIPAFLRGDAPPGDWLQSLETDAPGYAGFNLLLADRDSLWYASNRADTFARPLAPGIFGLSNEFLDTPWPKLVRVRSAFGALLESPAAADTAALTAGLFAMLADREPAPPDQVPPGDLSPEWARKLSAPFVLDPTYGTRCSTVLAITETGELTIAERRFDADGNPTAESERTLNVSAG
ncbi:MAG TPA: NRDE family protein [Steroidobacteraceae bacterium]|nr:NRDE family protein [Steroidobacteraceae bacterium]